MKKIAVILISFLYLFLSTGLVIRMHYCQDQLISVSFYGEAQKCCCALADEENNCCSDKQVVVQMDQEDQLVPTSATFYSDLQAVKINSIFSEIESPALNLQPETIRLDLPPPKVPAWKMGCSFLFYG
jgi:hypothetical protein